MRDLLIQRGLEWDGRHGHAQCGDTRHNFGKRPWVGVAQMVTIEYWPHQMVCRVREQGQDLREMTRDECLGVENRLYAMDRSAADPWREEWDKEPE